MPHHHAGSGRHVVLGRSSSVVSVARSVVSLSSSSSSHDHQPRRGFPSRGDVTQQHRRGRSSIATSAFSRSLSSSAMISEDDDKDLMRSNSRKFAGGAAGGTQHNINLAWYRGRYEHDPISGTLAAAAPLSDRSHTSSGYSPFAAAAHQSRPQPAFLSSFSGLLTTSELYQQDGDALPSASLAGGLQLSERISRSSPLGRRLQHHDDDQDQLSLSQEQHRHHLHPHYLPSTLPSRQDELDEDARSEALVKAGGGARSANSTTFHNIVRAQRGIQRQQHQSPLQSSEHQQRSVDNRQRAVSANHHNHSPALIHRAAASSVLRPQSSPYRSVGMPQLEHCVVSVGAVVTSPSPSSTPISAAPLQPPRAGGVSSRPGSSSLLLLQNVHFIHHELGSQRPPSALVTDARAALVHASHSHHRHHQPRLAPRRIVSSASCSSPSLRASRMSAVRRPLSSSSSMALPTGGPVNSSERRKSPSAQRPASSQGQLSASLRNLDLSGSLPSLVRHALLQN